MALLVSPAIARAAENANQPTTTAAAAKLLDLRTLPLPDGATRAGLHTLAMLMYETAGTPKSAFAHQLKHFTQQGWRELPGTYLDNTNALAHLTKNGFILALSASAAGSEPEKAGRASVTIVNHGNVELAKLPAPPGVKPFYSSPSQASYLTEAKVPETAEACRQLLLAGGWEPYGAASADPQSPLMYFKRNAIRLLARISTAPAQGNKTTIQYSTDLLSADLPVPPDAPDPRYNDGDKTLRYDYPGEEIAPIVDFYRQKLTAADWKPTTDNPVTDDSQGTAFLVFRNSDQELISIDMQHFAGIVRVVVSHQTAAELEEADRVAKQSAERRRQEMAEREAHIKLEVPLPPGAGPETIGPHRV